MNGGILLKEKFDVYRSKPLVIIILLFLLKPAYFSTFSMLDKLYTWGSFLCTLFLLLLVFITKRSITTPMKWTFAFYGTILISTIYHGGNVYQFMNNNFGSLAMCLLFSLWLDKSPETLIECFAVYEIYVYINLLTIIMFPDGLYNNGTYYHCWFLGYKNPQIRTILPILCMSMIRSYWKTSRISISSWLLIICCVLTFTLNNSATSLVGIVLFLGLFFLVNKKAKELPKAVTLINGLYVSVVACIAIVLFQKQYLFTNIIQGWLNRDLTFTTRVKIWESSWELIKEKPLLGYGFLTSSDYAKIFNSQYATHPHNYYMYLTITGGICLLAVLYIGFFNANKVLKKTSSVVHGKIILFALYSFLIMGLTESLTSTVLLYPMLILAMKSQNIVDLGFHKEVFKFRGKTVRLINRPQKNNS